MWHSEAIWDESQNWLKVGTPTLEVSLHVLKIRNFGFAERFPGTLFTSRHILSLTGVVYINTQVVHDMHVVGTFKNNAK